MNEDWWPSLLAHIPKETPWATEHVLVAEIRSFAEKHHTGQRTTYSVLVPIDELEAVKAHLANLDHGVRATGPRPYPQPERSYHPQFWISAHGLPSEKYEPLVLSWSSHDKTVLLPDPGFLMTYGLAQRTVANGLVVWDDPSKPLNDIVHVSAPSVWDFPHATTATVTIAKSYLQDYLSLRKMALVQVFYEIRWGMADQPIDDALAGKEVVEVKYSDRMFQLNRSLENDRIVSAQVWGARVVASPGDLPITEDTIEKVGLVWPGYAEPVTRSMAEGMGTTDFVYVDDTVLSSYEGRPEYRIHPFSGSVSFGTQWAVGYCDRVGRNLIRLELKKLYEGVPPAVTRHWSKFAVDPVPDAAYPEILRERNIATRAKDLIFAHVALGESLSALAQSVGLTALKPEDFVSLRRGALEYSGWWTFEDTEQVSRHIPRSQHIDAFLDRCLSLNKLIVEGLAERNIREMLLTIGVPRDEIVSYRTLKLMDCLVRMAQVAATTGLKLSQDGARIWERLIKEGTIPSQPI